MLQRFSLKKKPTQIPAYQKFVPFEKMSILPILTICYDIFNALFQKISVEVMSVSSSSKIEANRKYCKSQIFIFSKSSTKAPSSVMIEKLIFAPSFFLNLKKNCFQFLLEIMVNTLAIFF